MINCQEFKKPVVFFENGLGDYFITLPAIRALSAIFKGRLTVITGSLKKELLEPEDTGIVVAVEITDCKGQHYKKVNFDELERVLTGSDLYINLCPWYPSYDKAGYISMLERTGVTTAGYFNFYHHHTTYSTLQNAFDSAFQIPQMFAPGLCIDDFAGPPVFEHSVRNFITALRQRLPPDMLLLGVQDDTAAEKMWSPDAFETVIDQLLHTWPNLGVLVLGCNTRIRWQSTCNAGRILFFEQPLPFKVACALMGMVDCFLGVDSVFLHLADLYRRPAIGLFGPSSIAEWGIRFTEGSIISGPNGRMEDINCGAVYNAVNRMIEQQMTMAAS